MRAARYTQGQGLRFEDTPVPRIGADEILLRIAATSICGTDLKIVRHGHRRLREGHTLTLGHEFVGEIAELGSATTGFSPGMRVGLAPNIGCGHCEMCRHGLMNLCPDYTAFGITFDGSHTEFVRVPAAALAQGCVVPVPDHVPAVAASLAEPLSCVVNAQRIVRLEPGESILIYGAGPMGLLHVLLAKATGAEHIAMADVDDARLAAARALGATHTCNSKQRPVTDFVRELMGGRGLDVVVTAAPLPELQVEALGLLAPFGRLSLFAGLPGKDVRVPLDTNAIHYRSLLVTGTTGGSPGDYRTALKLIASGRVEVRSVVSHVFSLDEVEQAYAIAQARTGRKIALVRPDLLAAVRAELDAHALPR